MNQLETFKKIVWKKRKLNYESHLIVNYSIKEFQKFNLNIRYESHLKTGNFFLNVLRALLNIFSKNQKITKNLVVNLNKVDFINFKITN